MQRLQAEFWLIHEYIQIHVLKCQSQVLYQRERFKESAYVCKDSLLRLLYGYTEKASFFMHRITHNPPPPPPRFPLADAQIDLDNADLGFFFDDQRPNS
jgi:hypothetical protein